MAIRIKQALHDAARNTSPTEPRERDSLRPKTPRWELVLHDDESHEWSWRRIGIDGSIERTSGPYPDFGSAMGDAVKNGFCAHDQDWTIRTRKWTTHFPVGKTPFSMQAE